MPNDLETCLDRAVAEGLLTPGCAGAIVDPRGVLHRACAGKLAPDDEDGGPHIVSPSTVYDLASLTKLLCTTWLMAEAVSDGTIALDEEANPHWPGVTVGHLLLHTSGLPAHRPFFQALLSPDVSHRLGRRAGYDDVVDAVLRTTPETAPDVRVVYSDLGFIALGALLESRLGRRLDDAFAALLAREAQKASGLRFVCLEDEGFHPSTPLVAPTEQCPWRKRFVQGQVHDDNAFAMGGVGGHAGLFGSLDDVCAVAQALLVRLTDEPGGTLARFARARTPQSPTRALGFDVATPGGSTGDVLSASTVGHLGFAGTSLWFDLDARRAYVLLSNTVHLGRDGIGQRNKALRVAFHRAAATMAS